MHNSAVGARMQLGKVVSSAARVPVRCVFSKFHLVPGPTKWGVAPGTHRPDRAVLATTARSGRCVVVSHYHPVQADSRTNSGISSGI